MHAITRVAALIGRGEVAASQISPHVKDAAIDTEDPRFYSEGGVDVIGTIRGALATALGHGEDIQGGSSITEQYVKNVRVQECEQGIPVTASSRAAAPHRYAPARTLTGMPLSELSSTVQDYLKVVWSTAEWSQSPVTVTQLAARMGVRKATVSDAVRRLVDAGLVTHEPYGAVELTERGREHAVAMVRRHRILETFLVESLGYSWDEVHDEAERLEHAVSDTLIDRVDAMLGHPSRDPHGDPIPTREGVSQLPEAMLLADAPTGVPLTVERISDADPAVLRGLAARGIRPGSSLTAPVDLASAEASAIWVSPLAAG